MACGVVKDKHLWEDGLPLMVFMAPLVLVPAWLLATALV